MATARAQREPTEKPKAPEETLPAPPEEPTPAPLEDPGSGSLAERKAYLAKHGRVLCRALQCCLVEGRAYYAGEEFGMLKDDAERRLPRGEFELL
jgi:hypothetical protein